MCADKYPCIYLCQMKAIVYLFVTTKLKVKLSSFLESHASRGGGGEGGGGRSVVTDKESPLTVLFSDSSRISLVFTPSVH